MARAQTGHYTPPLLVALVVALLLVWFLIIPLLL